MAARSNGVVPAAAHSSGSERNRSAALRGTSVASAVAHSSGSERDRRAAFGGEGGSGGAPEPREFRFAWRPAGARAREYEMSDPRDQHQILVMPGVKAGNPPSVIAFHGQPRRGQSPRDYAFAGVVIEQTRQLVLAGEVVPLVLLIPRFRFEGQNWPAFTLDAFLAKANETLAKEGITLSHPYVLGHSGAAGCGGGGLNHAASVEPSAVAFFDTCVGPGFSRSVGELARRQIPVLILHSVETAGFRPRPPMEYVSDFDFGRVYRPLGLEPSPCPAALPEAPLRAQDYRCASNPADTTRAFVVNTGEGEEGHNAVVPVGLRFFLKEYLGGERSRPVRRSE